MNKDKFILLPWKKRNGIGQERNKNVTTNIAMVCVSKKKT